MFDSDSDHLPGGGIVEPYSGDLIAEVGSAIEIGSDATDLTLSIRLPPNLSEIISFAAEIFEGTIIDLIPPETKP